jgi:hypothetical protein
LEVRAVVVDMTEVGAGEHLDYLRYTGKAPYFGSCAPAELEATETPVQCRILPTHVVALDARSRTLKSQPLTATCSRVQFLGC